MKYLTMVKVELDGENKTIYIPEKLAEHGKSLRLKDHFGNWEEGWIVTATYRVCLAESIIKGDKGYEEVEEY